MIQHFRYDCLHCTIRKHYTRTQILIIDVFIVILKFVPHYAMSLVMTQQINLLLNQSLCDTSILMDYEYCIAGFM